MNSEILPQTIDDVHLVSRCGGEVLTCQHSDQQYQQTLHAHFHSNHCCWSWPYVGAHCAKLQDPVTEWKKQQTTMQRSLRKGRKELHKSR